MSVEETHLVLSCGTRVYFDAADAPLVKQYRWRACRPTKGRVTYAQTTLRMDGRPRIVLMHRLLMGFPPGTVDHIDSDGLNNRRANLRRATVQQQAWNTRGRSVDLKRAERRSRFKGVIWMKNPALKAGGAWRARIKVGAHILTRGAKTEGDAALWYNALALRHYGEYARLNEGD